MNTVSLLLIMIFAGVFGGGVNYLTYNYESKSKEDRIVRFIRSILTGVAASLLVPLFLNTISSNLVNSIDDNPNNLFIFIGFCLIASISSRVFIETLSQKIIRDVKKDVKKVKQEVTTLESKVEPIIDKETEIDESTLSPKEDNKNYEELSEKEKDLLRVLMESSYTFKSIKSLAKYMKEPLATTYILITNLEERGLINVDRTKSDLGISLTKLGRVTVLLINHNKKKK